MGHESLIEPWLPPDNRSACWFQSGLASSRRGDENRWESKPKVLRRSVHPSCGWRGRSEPTLFNHVGLEGREPPAVGELFLLTSPLIEPIGCRPPACLHHVQTRINIHDGQHPKVHRWSSKWKCGLNTVSTGFLLAAATASISLDKISH
jgi:hypothetical protein